MSLHALKWQAARDRDEAAQAAREFLAELASGIERATRALDNDEHAPGIHFADLGSRVETTLAEWTSAARLVAKIEAAEAAN